MERQKRKPNKTLLMRSLRLGAAFCVLIAAVLALPADAWFRFERKAAVVTKIDNPTAIYIKAANMEDIKYIDLSSIDKESNSYYDVVFSVCGTGVSWYKLQLAYTTNNQFEYEIYPAVKLTSGASMPESGIVVPYINNETPRAEELYYAAPSVDRIVGDFLNLDGSQSQILAYGQGETSNQMYQETYGEYGNVNKYAVPLYWHSRYTLVPNYPEGSTEFCDYYILRVKWTPMVNDKETDVIYIAAKVFSTASEPAPAP